MTTTPPPGDPYGSSAQPPGDPYGGATPYGASGYGGDPYGGYGYGPQQPPGPQPRNGLGITGLVLGILSVVSFWCYGVPGILFGIPGLIFGILGIRRARRGEATMGFGLSGTILSALGLVLSIVIIAIVGWVFGSVMECMNVPVEAQQQCIEENLLGG